MKNEILDTILILVIVISGALTVFCYVYPEVIKTLLEFTGKSEGWFTFVKLMGESFFILFLYAIVRKKIIEPYKSSK